MEIAYGFSLSCGDNRHYCLFPPPCFFSVPPSISGSSSMVEVVVNNLARLECEARGIPAPSLTWLKDGSPVSSFSNGIQVSSFFMNNVVNTGYSKFMKLLKRDLRRRVSECYF